MAGSLSLSNDFTCLQTSQTGNTQSSSTASDLVFPELLSEEESRLLLGFIEVTSTLVKCVQLVSISHSALDRGKKLSFDSTLRNVIDTHFATFLITQENMLL